MGLGLSVSSMSVSIPPLPGSNKKITQFNIPCGYWVYIHPYVIYGITTVSTPHVPGYNICTVGVLCYNFATKTSCGLLQDCMMIEFGKERTPGFFCRGKKTTGVS
jgi:hypothetical protein